jgi:hypothetical protein
MDCFKCGKILTNGETSNMIYNHLHCDNCYDNFFKIMNKKELV